MENSEKSKITYTKEILIKKLAEECKTNTRVIRKFYNALERNILEALSSASKDSDVSIRLFEGITINSTYIPEKTMISNLTGETFNASSKIKAKAKITRSYCQKITNLSN